MTNLERRRTRRFELADPVDYWWLAPNRSVQASHGLTVDISGSGVMVIAEKCPPKGARIQMTIHVNRPNGSDSSLELHGEGIVVRIQRGTSTRPSQRLSGFAALVHFYSELSTDSEDWITLLPSRINTLTAGRADENSDRAESFRRSRRSER